MSYLKKKIDKYLTTVLQKNNMCNLWCCRHELGLIFSITTVQSQIIFYYDYAAKYHYVISPDTAKNLNKKLAHQDQTRQGFASACRAVKTVKSHDIHF